MPSISKLIPNNNKQDNIQLGKQIRDLRKSKGITQSYLAEKTNKSVGYISQLERGISSVSIPVLQKISDILDVKITWFFHADGEQNADERNHVVRRDHRRQLNLSGVGIKEELLSPWLNSDVLMILTTLSPGAGSDLEARKRRGDEAGYIQSGDIELRIDETVFKLTAGDSFSIGEAEQYHIVNSSLKEPAIIVWVLPSASY